MFRYLKVKKMLYNANSFYGDTEGANKKTWQVK